MMRSKSPVKRSPMQTLARAGRAGTKLASAAAEAAMQGAQLSSVVASKAGAKAEETMERVEGKIEKRIERMRSPEKTTPGRRSAGGIRDRINMFDSASKNAVGYRHQGGGTPYKRQHRGSVVADENVDQMHDRAGAKTDEYDDYGPPPCNPGYNPDHYEKENEQNVQQSQSPAKSYAFTSKDGVKKLSPAFRRKKKKGRKQRHEMESDSAAYSPPVNPNYQDNHTNEVREEKMMETEELSSNPFEEEKRRMFVGHVDREMEVSHGYGNNNGRKEDKRHHVQTIAEDSEPVDIEEMNRAAAYAAIHGSKDTAKKQHAKSAPGKQKHRDASANCTSYGVNQHKKRDKEAHSLIQSPLRKHIKTVHDSACSNATCTVLKEPFQLFPPQHTGSALAAVAGWDRERSAPRLDTLGSVMTGSPVKSGGDGGKKRSSDEDGDVAQEEKKDGEEAALDLLTSAAFLFKHSRRNLG